ncbi:MAG: hypothetical protein DRJ13_13835, partial [Bacteroidetes bacterium]
TRKSFPHIIYNKLPLSINEKLDGAEKYPSLDTLFLTVPGICLPEKASSYQLFAIQKTSAFSKTSRCTTIGSNEDKVITRSI